MPHDGKTFGRLLVRGPAVAKSYFRGEGSRNERGESSNRADIFDTGDVATIDEDGYMQITDRAKDVIKSGGEWISSIEIEIPGGRRARRGECGGDRHSPPEMG